MDNLTHAIIGLAAGALIERRLAPEPTPARASTRRRLLLVAGALASNFPDIDLAFMPFLSRPLGYLLEHRGHTHTLLWALPQALLLAALLWLLWPAARRLLGASRAARTGLALAIGIGLLLHLGMDALNSYGVHPLAPFDARWWYGDAVFIVEPMFWVLLGVPLLLDIEQRSLRFGLLALLAGVLAACTALGFLLPLSLLLLVASGAALLLLHRRGHRALGVGTLLALAFIGVQAGAGGQARALVRAGLAEQDPGSRMLDAAMTPFPANPLCWSFVSVESDAGRGTYRLRRGVLSLAPTLVPTAACPPALAGGAAAPDSRGVAWIGASEARLDRLQALQQDNCHFDAWLRFARMPLVGPASATDARFGDVKGWNFSSIDYAARATTPCPAWLPRWGQPRADLLHVLPSPSLSTAP